MCRPLRNCFGVTFFSTYKTSTSVFKTGSRGSKINHFVRNSIKMDQSSIPPEELLDLTTLSPIDPLPLEQTLAKLDELGHHEDHVTFADSADETESSTKEESDSLSPLTRSIRQHHDVHRDLIRSPSSLKSSIKTTHARPSLNNCTVSANVATNLASTSVDTGRLRKIAEGMNDARTYSYQVLEGQLHPFLLKHVTPRAVNQRNVQLINIGPGTTQLDFRKIPQASAQPNSDGCSTSGNEVVLRKREANRKRHAEFLRPPNEFDWCSATKLGRILSLSGACEIFGLIQGAKCNKHLKELYINAKRPTYQACTEAALSSMSATLAELRMLQTLVLRGMCDDTMLKVIGDNIPTLKHLDVSGSQFVTDAGLQHLFYREANKHPSAYYLMTNWIGKNVDRLNPAAHSLTYLDYSWTNVTAMGRKMVQLLKGSYQFRRLMSRGEEDVVAGHHIFIKEAATLQDEIPSPVGSLQYQAFEALVSQFIGPKGVKHFTAIVENHPWRNCVLTVYSPEKQQHPVAHSSGPGHGISKIDHDLMITPDDSYYGIITPNKHEKRIQGIIYWDMGLLTQLYSIYPININVLGNLNFLRAYRGIVNDTWRLVSSLLPDLTQLEIFTEPVSLMSFIEFCPNLKKLHVRIRRNNLMDDHITKSIQNSMCRQSLEDIWIAPDGTCLESSILAGISNNQDKGDKEEAQHCNLVQLSLECVESLIASCPKLKKIGDLSMWNEVDAEELFVFCDELKKKSSHILITWSNLVLPDYTKRKQVTFKN